MAEKPGTQSRPSLPREAPWEQLEEAIGLLRIIADKLNNITPSGAMVPSSLAMERLYEKFDDLVKALRLIPIGLPQQIATLNLPAWNHGHKDVTTAGSAEQLPSLAIPDGIELVVRANPDNTDDIYIGRNRLEASRDTSRITLAPGEAVKLKIADASLVFVDAAVSGEGVEFWAEQG